MLLGKVVGNLVSTRKNEALTGNKFLIVEVMESAGDKGKKIIVAIDNAGAGIGETVLVSIGSAARIATHNENAPVDAAVVGIVDSMDGIHIALSDKP